MNSITKDPFSLFVLCLLGGAFLMVVVYQVYVRMKGIEAQAVVTWVETKETYDSDTGISYYDEVHVAYTAKDGEHVEGTLSNVMRTFTEGERIRIKYIPSRKENPVYIGRLEQM